MRKRRYFFIFVFLLIAPLTIYTSDAFALSSWHDDPSQTRLLSVAGTLAKPEGLSVVIRTRRGKERLSGYEALSYLLVRGFVELKPGDGYRITDKYRRKRRRAEERRTERERRSRQLRWQPGVEPGGIQDPDTGQSVPFTNCYCANETGMKDSCTEGCRLIEEKALSFEKCFWKCTDGKGTFYHINGDTGALMKKWTMGSSDN